MDNTIRLKLIEPYESNANYVDAYQSYKEIYNNAMAKGKGNLEPKFLGGNPIQLDTSNLNSIFKIDKNDLVYNDYFVSTKANGLRFMLMIGNSEFEKIDKENNLDNGRNFYLLNAGEHGSVNFWTISQEQGNLPHLPVSLNVDKCLIDGEVLFWGNVSTRVVGNKVKEYIISSSKNNKPLIAFLAFDILYGPRDPNYVRPVDTEIYSHHREYNLGGTSAMIGPKASGRWPTNRRRNVLEEMFLNPDSPLWKFIHLEAGNYLHKVEYTTINGISSVKNHTKFNFTIFVSPFVNMTEMLQVPRAEIYNYMIKILHDSIKEQYFYIDTNFNKVQMTLPPTPKKINHLVGKGYSTDGLIFTPAVEDYLIGPWTFCNNKQYKWKPVNQLTIDFEIGKMFSEGGDGKKYYEALVKQSKDIVNFKYKINDIEYLSLIESDNELIKGNIVECIYSDKFEENNEKFITFDIEQIRYDKEFPNAYLTAESVLNASNINKELDFMKISNPSVLDLIMYLKKFNTLSKEKKINTVSALGITKLRKSMLNKLPELLLEEYKNDILSMITQKQHNSKLELELRLDFGSSKNNYSSCLINNLLGSDYSPVPIVKIFDKTNDINKSTRSVYALLGDNENSLILEETIEKKQIEKPLKLHSKEYNYFFDIILSEENIIDKQISYGSSNSGNTEYQIRYTVTNISEFWRIDIIEYGNSKTLEKAKSDQEQHPKTRIELEYTPAPYLEDLLNWENQEVIDLFLKDANITADIPRDILVNKLENYKKILNKTNPEIILKDLARVLIKIFNVLDTDLGNSHDNMEKEKRIKTRLDKEQEHEEQPEKLKEHPEKQISKFARLRNFHNQIKTELIEEVASNFEKPISLLDISVGKGGDIYKWNKINKSGYPDIDEVYGIDPDKNSIKEAQMRFNEGLKSGTIKPSRKYKFEQKTITDPSTNIPGKYNIVSCQFTLHYFFNSDITLNNVVEKISNALKPGGYFIGTTMVKQNLQKLILKNQFEEFKIKQINDESYTMTYDDPTMYSSELPEYFVNFDKFINICKSHDLQLVVKKEFSEIYKDYKKNLDKKSILKPYEQAISELNITFIFQKK